jgi:hypothetical protein
LEYSDAHLHRKRAQASLFRNCFQVISLQKRN